MLKDSPCVDVALSLRLGRTIDAQPQECWDNAIRAWFADIHGETACYVEGWCVVPLPGGGAMAVEHGWLETAEGHVVDPTYAVIGGDWSVSYQYAAGVRYDQGTVLDHCDGTSGPPFVWRGNGFGGHRHDGYRAARDAALAAAGLPLPGSHNARVG